MIKITQNSKKGNTITLEQLETLRVLSKYNVLPEINFIDLKYEPLYFLCEKETICPPREPEVVGIIVTRVFSGTKTWIENMPAQDYCHMIGLYSDGKFSSAYLNNLLKEKKKLLYLNKITEHQNEIARTVEKIRQLS
jgi:hypothetical protein